MPRMHVPKGVLVELLQNVVNGSIVVDIPIMTRNHTIYVRGVGPVSAGAIQLATSSANGYPDTFSPLGTPVTVPANGEAHVTMSNTPLNCLKVSVSTPVTGGNAIVRYIGN